MILIHRSKSPQCTTLRKHCKCNYTNHHVVEPASGCTWAQELCSFVRICSSETPCHIFMHNSYIFGGIEISNFISLFLMVLHAWRKVSDFIGEVYVACKATKSSLRNCLFVPLLGVPHIKSVTLHKLRKAFSQSVNLELFGKVKACLCGERNIRGGGRDWRTFLRFLGI